MTDTIFRARIPLTPHGLVWCCETRRNHVQPHRPEGRLEINGTAYLPLDHIAQELGVSRTTLLRWRQSGRGPVGHRYRGRLTLFTLAEFEAIRDYANRLAPVGLGAATRDQTAAKGVR